MNRLSASTWPRQFPISFRRRFPLAIALARATAAHRGSALEAINWRWFKRQLFRFRAG